jgi:hypothetical protein
VPDIKWLGTKQSIWHHAKRSQRFKRKLLLSDPLILCWRSVWPARSISSEQREPAKSLGMRPGRC